ncbi:MAG: hypothetical protein QF441_10620 [Bacteriovoracaceae bacterium]|jgi:hypothetical protein|nr:hypothetical protein [Bacteriovoracaceae bacterium]
MNKKYQKLFSKLVPYYVCSHELATRVNKKLLDQFFKETYYFNPLLLESRDFIEKIYHMDEITFGSQQLGMDRWVFFDCSVMPGFVFGLMINSSELDDSDRETLGIEKNEFFPLSMYIAIPCAGGGWFGHNLSSLNGKLNYDLSGLGFLTKTLALKFFGIEKHLGATQWDSDSVFLHLKISKLKLMSAYTPIHSIAETFSYEAETFHLESLLAGIQDQREKEQAVDFDPTLKNICELQEKIEAGALVYLLGVKKEKGKNIFQILYKDKF